MSKIKDEKLEKEIEEVLLLCEVESLRNTKSKLSNQIEKLKTLIHQRDIELKDKWHKAGYIDGVNESKKREQERYEKLKEEITDFLCDEFACQNLDIDIEISILEQINKIFTELNKEGK